MSQNFQLLKIKKAVFAKHDMKKHSKTRDAYVVRADVIKFR